MRGAHLRFAVAAGLVLLTVPRWARAANPAADNAADPAYADGWQNADNGGTGFGPWLVELFGTGSKGLGSSTLNGDTNGDGDIDTGGKSWMLSAGDNGVAQAFRDLTGGPLMPGEGILLAGDYVPPADPNANYFAGAAFGNTLGEARLIFGLETGRSDYFVEDASGIRSTGFASTSDGLSFEFTLDTFDTYTLRLTELATGNTGTMSGSLLGTPGSRINHFGMSAQYYSGYSGQDSFFNSVSVVVPEPSGPLAALALVGSLMPRFGRRRAIRS